MRTVHYERKFRKDYKRQEKRGKKLQKLQDIIARLALDGELSADLYPHKLIGNYKGHWECHIEPDWLLIYLISDDDVVLVRTGTHSDLFD